MSWDVRGGEYQTQNFCNRKIIDCICGDWRRTDRVVPGIEKRKLPNGKEAAPPTELKRNSSVFHYASLKLGTYK